jgi:hypothetical protein
MAAAAAAPLYWHNFEVKPFGLEGVVLLDGEEFDPQKNTLRVCLGWRDQRSEFAKTRLHFLLEGVLGFAESNCDNASKPLRWHLPARSGFEDAVIRTLHGRFTSREGDVLCPEFLVFVCKPEHDFVEESADGPPSANYENEVVVSVEHPSAAGWILFKNIESRAYHLPSQSNAYEGINTQYLHYSKKFEKLVARTLGEGLWLTNDDQKKRPASAKASSASKAPVSKKARGE